MANGNGGTGSIKYAAGLALGVLGVSATIAAGIGRYSGWEGAKDAIAPEILRFDAMVSAARLEADKRREEIRAEAIEERREVETRLRAALEYMDRQNETEHVEMQEIIEMKADEDHLGPIHEEISRIRDRIERIEALVYGRSGGAR